MYNILRIPNEKLRKPTSKIDNIKEQKETLSSLCSSMYEVMQKVKGVGLAANQIGVDMQLFVAKINNKPYYFLNPKILEEVGEQKSIESCLSVPGYMDTVPRPREIVVEWTTIEGETRQERFIGFNACIVSHEIDHLHGRLYIDYLPEFKREKAKKKVEIWKRRQKKQK